MIQKNFNQIPNILSFRHLSPLKNYYTQRYWDIFSGENINKLKIKIKRNQKPKNV